MRRSAQSTGKKAPVPRSNRDGAVGTGPAGMADRVGGVLAWLERRGTKRNRDGMARYGIRAAKVFGVSVSALQGLARRLGRDHDLAAALWQTGWYEARMLTAFVTRGGRSSSRSCSSSAPRPTTGTS
jgi:DNA alkylation repair enzyme